VKIAAIQLDADYADVKANLIKSEKYIRQAALAGAGLVLLPEFFTSAAGFSERMLKVAVQNKRIPQLLKQWSAEYGTILGGSYISFDGENAFNTFILVFPDGAVFEHKKDIPTQFENCYYTNGDENNILVTPIGNIGVALCWEMIRYDTLRRISGKADLVLAGSCWWDLPEVHRRKGSAEAIQPDLARGNARRVRKAVRRSGRSCKPLRQGDGPEFSSRR
jgi:predicted amidohydrolase